MSVESQQGVNVAKAERVKAGGKADRTFRALQQRDVSDLTF